MKEQKITSAEANGQKVTPDELKDMILDNARTVNGGAKIYSCPWSDYRSTNFWSVYAHAVKCGYKHGLFNIPISMIKVGIGMM